MDTPLVFKYNTKLFPSLLFCICFIAPFSLIAQAPFCLNFSPYYKVGQDPRIGSNIPITQVVQGLEAIKPYCNCIRIFAANSPLDSVAYIAKEMGFETIIVGIWLDSDTVTNNREIEQGIKLAQDGVADRLVVGSEVGLRNEFSIHQWIEYINYVNFKVPEIPVSAADVYGILTSNPEVLEAVDFIFYNAYPFWEGTNIDCAPYAFNEMYQTIKEIAGDKEIMVSETGWPTEGNTVGGSTPSLTNLQFYLTNLLAWKESTGISLTWFSAFDEPWKSNVVNPQEAFWGLFTYNAELDSLILKEGLHEILTQATNIDSTTWNCQFIENEENSPRISFNQIPTYGDQNGILCGKVDGIRPCDYILALYIQVNGRWWVKPTYAAREIRLACDGSFCIDVVTGGFDRNATEYQLFLLDKECEPPGLGNAPSIPDSLYEKAIAHEIITRTPFDYGQLFMERPNEQVIKRGDTLSIPVKVQDFDTVLYSSGGIYTGDRELKLINAHSNQFADLLTLTIVDSTQMTFELEAMEEGIHIPDSTTLFSLELLVGEKMSYCRSVKYSDEYLPFQTTHLVDQQPQMISTKKLGSAVICPTVPLKLNLDTTNVNTSDIFDISVWTTDFIRVMAFDVGVIVGSGLEILEVETVNLSHGYEYEIVDDSLLLFHYDIRDTNEIFRSGHRMLFQAKVGIKEEFEGCKEIRFSTDSLYRRSIQLVRLDTTILEIETNGTIEICPSNTIDQSLLDYVEVNVFPNPSRNGENLNIHLLPKDQQETIKVLQVQIFDLLGNIVFTDRATNLIRYIKGVELNSGLFIVALKDDLGRNFRAKVLVY